MGSLRKKCVLIWIKINIILFFYALIEEAVL